MSFKYKKSKGILLRSLSLLLLILLFSLCTIPAYAEKRGEGGKLLYAGGIPFGVKFFSRGVTIAGFCDIPVLSGGVENPALSAGLEQNDIIISVNGKEPESCEDFLKMIESSCGAPLKIVYLRNGDEHTSTLTPLFSPDEGKFKCGIYIKQGGAGIGTVTYIDPETLEFGGLGHGICDTQNGKLLPITHGVVMDVKISGLVKGRAGAPGEIKGSFTSVRMGLVRTNTDCGVFGAFSALPANFEAKKYPVGARNEVKDGKAQIICSLDESGKSCFYDIEISSINRESRDNKSFSVKITDPNLIERSGGIIQGMSGSPIIQNNRIIGAITHVMVNDPTVGYGIFIENMLEIAE